MLEKHRKQIKIYCHKSYYFSKIFEKNMQTCLDAIENTYGDTCGVPSILTPFSIVYCNSAKMTNGLVTCFST